MLLSGLKSHAIGWVAVSVFRKTDDSSRHFPDVLFFGREKSRIGSSEAHRNSKSLSGTEAYISSHLTCRLGDAQGKQVRGNNFCNFGLGCIDLREEVSKIVEYSFGVRCLDNNSTKLFGTVVFEEVSIFANNYLNVEEAGLCLNHSQGRLEDSFVYKYLAPLPVVNVVRHVECFTACTRLIEKRGITELQLGDFLDHRLIVDEGFESAL